MVSEVMVSVLAAEAGVVFPVSSAMFWPLPFFTAPSKGERSTRTRVVQASSVPLSEEV